jgi:hypothetical protein
VTQLASYFNASQTANPRTRDSVRRASGFVQIAITFIMVLRWALERYRLITRS